MRIRTYIKGKRGGTLITSLVFVTICAYCLAGMGKLGVSQYSRAGVERDYVAALYLAEAGINYEIRKISQNSANADQKSNQNPNGPSYTLGNGTFNVYCANTGGSIPWTTGSATALITSIGKVNGVSRKVTVQASGYSSSGSATYAIYGAEVTASSTLSGTVDVTGNVGLNHPLTVNGNVTVTGTVYLNGSSASYTQNGASASVTTTTTPDPVVWPTVTSIATGLFPSGGLTWLASNNDNSLASPAITSTNISLTGSGKLTFKGKAGGANYYLTSIKCVGNSTVVFDNTNGPITIWFGPVGGTGQFSMRGGSANIKMSTDPTKPVKIYSALDSPMSFGGNSRLDAGIYNRMGSGYNNSIDMKGTFDHYGCVIGDKLGFSGTPTIIGTSGFFTATGSYDYYQRTATWIDSNSINQ